MCVYSFYSTWSVNQWDLWEGTVANQVGQLQGFIAVGDHPKFEALRQACRCRGKIRNPMYVCIHIMIYAYV